MIKRFVALKPFNNKIYYQNEIFNLHSFRGSAYLIAAKKLLSKRGIEINTVDIAPNIPTLKDIYMDLPYPWEIQRWIRIIKNTKKNILFIGEPPIVNPFNHMKIFHIFFSKIYTWNDNIVDNKKYFKYYLPVTTERVKTKLVLFKDKKLLVMMNMNWLPFLPFKLLSLQTRELYTERVKAIDFLDKFYPLDLYLYGRGWNRPQKFSIKQKIFGYKKYKTYQGEFDQKDKYKILSQFKFCLCFDNNEINGNISEKIIDCFKAGCVPVYWGAPNIKKDINYRCFINYREFKNLTDLIEFLKGMSEKTHSEYLKNIKAFLSSKEFYEKWSPEAFARLFAKAIS